ncbi:endonuclease domain-containing protein [Dysgonomonas termitidis]|uniref:Endonuclease domain-containing protein n=1 Tax=Dysgonomonas termitidis TaxID=1516126 RepID=A0ABV9KRU0_9BACT
MKKVKFSGSERMWIIKHSGGQKDVLEFLNNGKKKLYKKKKPAKYLKEFKFKEDNFDLSDYEGCDYADILRKRLISKSTKAEKELYDLLGLLNIKYEKQYPIKTSGKLYFADVYIPEAKAVIELDGLYHKSEKVANADRIRNAHIRKAGFRIIRFDNEDVFDRIMILDRINKLLNLGLKVYQYM